MFRARDIHSASQQGCISPSESQRPQEDIGMRTPVAVSLAVSTVVAICIQVACNRGPGISPSPIGYVGNWAGETEQGTPIDFSVSTTDTVTSITIVYNFSPVCSGTLAYTDLALPIHTLDPPGPPPFDQPGFGYATNDGTKGTLIAGKFSEDRRSASGQFTLVQYGACDTVVSKWNATRR